MEFDPKPTKHMLMLKHGKATIFGFGTDSAFLCYSAIFFLLLTNRNRITYYSDEVLLPRNIKVRTASCFSYSSKPSEEFFKLST